MPDRNIVCVDCGAAFVFTEREQEWYREKGLSHEPRRCKTCRGQRKSGGGGPPRADAPPPPREGGGSGGSHPRRPSRDREMFTAACATCGKPTEVPFRPDTSRPVYCRDCYVARGKKR